MPASKQGFANILVIIFAVVITIAAVGVPLFVSKAILPRIKQETAAGFPNNQAEIKDYIDKNSEPWVQNKQGMKYMGFELPTQGELQSLKKSTDLTRHYPTSLKAVFDPGPISNTVDLLYYSDELIELGVNTYWVIGEYRMKNYKAAQFSPNFSHLGFPLILADEEANRVLAWRILLAKRLGFATILIPDYPSVFNIGRQNFDLAKAEPEFKRVALELAKIAEDYGVEYFAPLNEYNHLLISNGYSIDEIVENEKKFYDDLLPKVRAIYKGKVVIKNGAVNDWNNFKKESMKGADLFGVGNGFTGIRTKENMEPKVEAANFVSERDNVPWFESEFLVYRPIDQENWLGYLESEVPMENTYKEGLDIFASQAKGAIGFTFMGWTGVGRIRGTPAASVLKDFYTKWQPTVKLRPDNNVVKPFLGGQNSSITGWFENIPNYYSLVFKMLTGQMRPAEKEAAMGEGALPCKGKEECDAYCAKPEHQAECIKAKGGGADGGPEGGQDPQQGGPGGCKSDQECQTYCSKPENQQECLKFRGGQQGPGEQSGPSGNFTGPN